MSTEALSTRLFVPALSGPVERVSAAAESATATFLLDTLSCALAGSTGPSADAVLTAARRWGDGGRSLVPGTGVQLPAASASVVTAYQIHCLEYDCVHERAVLHPMSSLVAAVLAECDRRGAPVTGAELLGAIVHGIEVTCSIGVAATGPMKFFRPSSIGCFGATVAVARLRGLDVEAGLDALGHVYGMTSGTLQPHVEGSRLLGLQVGFAARAAQMAVDLAEAGIPGPRDILEGQYGYLRLFEDSFDAAAGLARPDGRFRIEELAHKPYPCGRLTHYAIDGILALAPDPAAVESVTLEVPPLVARLVGRPDVPSPAANYARLCLPFVVATALRYGAVLPGHFAPAALSDPATHAVAGRVIVRTDANPDPNAFGPQRVTVRERGGRERSVVVEAALGDPRRPLPKEQQVAKLLAAGAAARVPVAPDALLQVVERLSALRALPDVRLLWTPAGQ